MASKQKKEMGAKFGLSSELFVTLHFLSIDINSKIFLCVCAMRDLWLSQKLHQKLSSGTMAIFLYIYVKGQFAH